MWVKNSALNSTRLFLNLHNVKQCLAHIPMDLRGFVVMDTSTYLVFFARSIKYVHLDVCYICLNVLNTFFTPVNNIKQLCNLCWKTEHISARYFNIRFSPLKFQICTPCPHAILVETEHDLQEPALSVGFYYEGPCHVPAHRQGKESEALLSGVSQFLAR